MKKRFLIGIVLFSLKASVTIAQTNVPAGSVSGIWTSAGSPYLIQGNIQIPNDSTLTIKPGVTVNFQGTFKLNVQGQLLAIGTSSDSVIFTASNTTNGWRGIRFNNTAVDNDSSKIIFCKLQYGKASGSSPDDCGGAFYFNNFSKTLISNSSIINCAANSYGGGIYCNSSSPVISNNTISYNQVPGEGGGIFSVNGNPVIANNTISNNTANCCVGSNGGGIYCSGGNPAITSNTITNNIASNGGGIYCNGNSPIISKNSISKNIATYGMGGGGIYSDKSSPDITANNIFDNSASNGGGIYCSDGFPIINNNSLTNNNATIGGGLFLNYSSNLSLSNDIICNNTASANGGGIYCQNSGNPTFLNSNIVNNSSDNGGALYCSQSSNPNFRNCILYGNTASTSGAQVFLYDETSDPGFNFCDVQGGSAAFEINGNSYTGTYQNNINTDPHFVSPSSGSGTGYNGLSADWSLQNSSACIDKGDTSFNPYPATDRADNPRVNVCRVDIGAYEYQTGIPFVVSVSISKPIICNGDAGELVSVVSGGTQPYNYHWSNGQTTTKITGLVAGNYSVTVSTPGNACSITKSISLKQPPVNSVDTRADTTLICGSSVQLIAFPKWIKLNSGINYPLNSVFFTDANTGYAVGGVGGLTVGGKILKTTDGGASWTEQTSGTFNTLYSVFFTDFNTGYVTGDLGTILRTTNGGLNWTTQPLGAWLNPLYSVYFTNNETGYAVGSSNIIFKTTDRGANWSKLTPGYGSSFNLYSVFFINADTGYTVGNIGAILKTIDGGTNWNTQTSGTGNNLNSIYFTDANTGYIAGDNGIILKSNNGGTSWTTQISGTNSALRSINFTDVNSGIAVGNLGTILITHNGGTNWTRQTSGTNSTLNSVYFTDANTGYAVGVETTLNDIGTMLKLNMPISYSWSPVNYLNDANISNPIANPNITTNYIITAASNKGCIAKDTVTVFVNPLTINSGTDKSIICGGNVQFDNPITNYIGSDILTYSWLPSEGLSAANIAQPTVEIISDKTYKSNVSTPNGCNAFDSVKVTVKRLEVKVDDITVSCGNTAQLNAVTNYTGSGSLIINWSPASGLSSTTISNPFVTIQSPGNYSVEVKTSNNECMAIDNVNVNTSVISFIPSICMVTVSDTDKNVIVWQKENNFAIDSIFIFRESSYQTEQYDVIGKLPYSAVGVLTDSTSDASVQSNKYKIAVKDVCGFITDLTSEHKTMHLTINKGVGNTWNLIWEQYIGETVSSYGIYRGTTKSNLIKIGSSSGSNTTYTDKTAPEGDAYYQIEVVLPQACSNLKSTGYGSSHSNIISSANATTGISVNSVAQEFIYPNPAFDKLNIKTEYSSYAMILIYDLHGKQVLSKQLSSGQIDISNLSKGIYFVKLIDSGNVLINKFLKE